MVWFGNNKVMKFVLITLEIPSEHHRSVSLAGWVVTKCHMFDSLFSQKENAFHLTFPVGQPTPNQ